LKRFVTFNENRSIEENKRLLDEIVRLLELKFTENIIKCRVQYVVRLNKEKIRKDSYRRYISNP